MDIPQAIVLGVVQGAAEFLPISSSAHLILAPWFFGWEDPGLTIDVALHIGTLVALLLFFWRDWLDIIRTGFGGIGTAPRNLLWYIAIASIPGAVVGALLEKAAEGTFRTPLLIAATLTIGGLLLLWADQNKRTTRMTDTFSFRDALLIGCAQACAIIPGISRSGSTITAARALGFGRDAAARLSFLLAAPITGGAVVFSLRHLSRADVTLPFFVGIFVSALVGMLAIRFLLRYVARADYRPFVWYRIALAAIIVLVFFLKR
ncbi:undecaprenyl-diphosphate phosphatase [Patescibacteria group bacterium]|nr:undecaprenyl-diphosphate phosphatase [Patescibacteria group bacterium]